MGGYSNLSKMSQQQKQFSQHQQMHPGQMHGHVGVSYRTFLLFSLLSFKVSLPNTNHFMNHPNIQAHNQALAQAQAQAQHAQAQHEQKRRMEVIYLIIFTPAFMFTLDGRN